MMLEIPLLMAMSVLSQTSPDLVLKHPLKVHELELIWVEVHYPSDVAGRWRRASLVGNPDWPEVDIRLESPPGNLIMEDADSLIDPERRFVRFVCNRPIVGSRVCRSGESFPLQLLTGPLTPGTYRATVSVSLSRYSLREPDAGQTGPMTAVGSTEFEVTSTTQEERARIIAEGEAAIARLSQDYAPVGFSELAPLLLEGSARSLRAVAYAGQSSGRRHLARMLQSTLMREPSRMKSVELALGCLMRAANENPFFEDSALRVLCYRARATDAEAIIHVMEQGTHYGQKLAICLAAYVFGPPGVQWSPIPDYVASQISDESMLKAKMREAVESPVLKNNSKGKPPSEGPVQPEPSVGDCAEPSTSTTGPSTTSDTRWIRLHAESQPASQPLR